MEDPSAPEITREEIGDPDPTVDVRNGPQTTTDEMMFFALEWVMPNRKP